MHLYKRGKSVRDQLEIQKKKGGERAHRTVRDKTRPRHRSLIQANVISVTVQADHMTHTYYCSLFIYLGTRTHIHSTMSHILWSWFPHTNPRSLEARQMAIQTHTWAHRNNSFPRVCQTTLNSRYMLPVCIPLTPCSCFFFFPLMDLQPLGLPCHVIWGCVSLQTIWALRGLVDLQPAPLGGPAV